MGIELRRERRRPEEGVLFQVVAQHLDTFLAHLEHDDCERSLPSFVRRELNGYLRCGILAHGFCRVHCAQCDGDELVAFSCKRRGFCPSCGSRRMADLAAHLVDSVLPDVPVRQWVLSLPHRVRLLCAYDPSACTIVRRIFVRAVSGFYLRRARRSGLARPNVGAVVFAQRFDSGLRLNLHFHGLWLDGAFACPLGNGRADFDPHGDVTDRDVERTIRAIRSRVLRALRRLGKLPPGDDVAADIPPDVEPSLLLHLGAAAIQGRTALGERQGAHDQRPGRGSRQDPFQRGPLCSDLDGFSLHAAVRIPAGCRERLEKLCRYAARPPIVEDRLSLLPDGRVSYRLKKRYRDGSTHVVLDPLTFLERLCALVPRPRRMMLTYHGVLAPAASMRDRVVPPPPLPDDDDGADGAGGCDHLGQRERRRPQSSSTSHGRTLQGQPFDNDPLRRRRMPSVPHAPRKNHSPRQRHSWAELLRRVYLIDVLTCPTCRGRRTLLAAIHDPDSIRRILHHLGLPAEPPAVAPARPPPQARLPW